MFTECKNDAVTSGEMQSSDKLFRFILKCQKNYNKPDLHSFWININGGRAYVECRGYEVFMEIYIAATPEEKKIQWVGTAVAAANKLDLLGANYRTIEM